MQYSYIARNTGKDNILSTRLRLISKLNFDYNKNSNRYAYYMKAYLGILTF